MTARPEVTVDDELAVDQQGQSVERLADACGREVEQLNAVLRLIAAGRALDAADGTGNAGTSRGRGR